MDGVGTGGVDEAASACGSVEQVAAVCENGVPPALVRTPEIMWIDLAATCMSSLMESGLPRSLASSTPKILQRRPSS